jgi:hypothetical protein
MWGSLRPEAVAETEKVFLVDTLQDCANGVLDDLVFQGRDPQRSLSTVSLFNVNPFGWLRPEGSAVNATVKIIDAIFQVLLVFMPCHFVDANSRFLLEPVKARSQQFDIDVMKQGGELEVTARASRLTHTVQTA